MPSTLRAANQRTPAEPSLPRRIVRYWPALILFAGLTCPLVLSTWYTFNKQRAALQSAFTLELEQMTSVLANGMREPIWNLSPELGKPLLDSVMGDERVVTVRVTSEVQGTFLEDARRDGAPAELLRFAGPVVREEVGQIGEVVIEADASAVATEIGEEWPEIYAAGIVQALLGLGVVGFVYWALRRQERHQALREMNRLLTDEVQRRADALKAANDELRRQENLATLGRLTATVSHELRNPLGTIRNSLEIISWLVPGADPGERDRAIVTRALSRAHRNVERCSKIADQLLGFTRAGSVHRVPTVLDEWLEEQIAEYELPDDVTLELELHSDATVAVDPDRLRQALYNLIGNAVQAMGQVDGPAGSKSLSVSATRARDAVEIRVRDTGDGVVPELREQVFEPLFSTRNFGFGLGLPLVRQIAQQHGGSVEIIDVDEGAEFLVRLPLTGLGPAREGGAAPARG